MRGIGRVERKDELVRNRRRERMRKRGMEMEGRVRVRKWNEWEFRLTKIPQILYFPVSTISILKVNFKNKVSFPTAQVKYVCSLGKWGGNAYVY